MGGATDRLIVEGTFFQDAVADAAAATAAALTDNSGGTKDGTIEAVPSDTLANNAAAANNNFAECADQIGKLIADVADIRTQLNALISRLEKAQIIKK